MNLIGARKTFILISLLLGLTLVGVMGYSLIEGWDIRDALYMTVITLTTTGYQEVHQLSPQGRMFTVFYLIVSVGAVAYSATTIMGAFTSINFQARRRKKMDSRIENLHHHIIVCGFGRMGKIICQELNKANFSFVVIEKNEKVLETLDELNYLFVEGDASEDNILVKAGIKSATKLVSMVDSDADALYLTLAARNLNPNIHITTRANNESAQKKIQFAGANKVVLPILMSSFKVAQSIINPNIEDFLEIASGDSFQKERLEIVDIRVKPGSKLINKNLASSGLRKFGLIVIGIRQADKSFVFAPDAARTFQQGETLIALGTSQAVAEVGQTFEI